MPICDKCGEEEEKLYKCQNCEEMFCEWCGSKDEMLCIDCMEDADYEEQDDEDDEEDDEE